MPAARAGDAQRRVPAGVRLVEVLCAREARAVGRDWCVRWRRRLPQVDAAHAVLDLPRSGGRVEVTEKADGARLVRYRGADLTWCDVSAPDPRPATKRLRKPVTNNKVYKPAADHPFDRRAPTGRSIRGQFSSDNDGDSSEAIRHGGGNRRLSPSGATDILGGKGPGGSAARTSKVGSVAGG